MAQTTAAREKRGPTREASNDLTGQLTLFSELGDMDRVYQVSEAANGWLTLEAEQTTAAV